jgi:hypothetical protein
VAIPFLYGTGAFCHQDNSEKFEAYIVLDLKTYFLKGRLENKEKRLSYFDLRYLFPIQINLLDVELPKK